jgi:hypothetical protein
MVRNTPGVLSTRTHSICRRGAASASFSPQEGAFLTEAASSSLSLNLLPEWFSVGRSAAAVADGSRERPLGPRGLSGPQPPRAHAFCCLSAPCI